MILAFAIMHLYHVSQVFFSHIEKLEFKKGKGTTQVNDKSRLKSTENMQINLWPHYKHKAAVCGHFYNKDTRSTPGLNQAKTVNFQGLNLKQNKDDYNKF